MPSYTVFCGASTGSDPRYIAAARELGRGLAEKGIRLVYGGGSSGLMGALAHSVLEHGGRVLGVIPEAFLLGGDKKPVLSDEQSDRRNEQIIVRDMHTRKQRMAAECDAFVVLPGGYGTLEELAEMTTWTQLRIHNKPVVLLNVNGFFSPLRMFVEGAIDAGFIGEQNRQFMAFVDGPSEARAAGESGEAGKSENSAGNGATRKRPTSNGKPATNNTPDRSDTSFNWGDAAVQAVEAWVREGSGGGKALDLSWT